jgi:hypothetical protein
MLPELKGIRLFEVGRGMEIVAQHLRFRPPQIAITPS